jgi:signal transduction histidine kinase
MISGALGPRGGLSLSQRFAAAGGLVMLLAMASIGWWVTARIEQNVIESTATATALYMDSFIAPLAQELETADTLSIGPIRAIEELLTDSPLGERIVAVKIWKPDGRVAYSGDPALVGQTFPLSPALASALKGTIVAELDHLDDEENRADRARNVPLLEIYSPLREAFSGHILGAVEFYEDAAALEQSLARVRLQSWAVVASIALAIAVTLFGIVHRGSRLIDHQRLQLQSRLREIETVSAQNAELRRRVERAAHQVSEANERTLRRVSAELHDGPKQLIGFAAMRLAAVGKGLPDDGRAADILLVRDALSEALREIGNLCSDLAVPEIGALTVPEIVQKVAAAHRLRTGTDIAFDLDPAPTPRALSQAVRLCVYRFVQEALNNAWRHASGAAQTVKSRQSGSTLDLSVSNADGTPRPVSDADRSAGLGLAGLRERVESLGGRFEFGRTPKGGAVVRMVIDVNAYGEKDA